jgi:hypothetical protein
MDLPSSVLYVGSTTDSVVPHWGGSPRRAEVLGRRTLARGDAGWLVRLDDPIPSTGGPAFRLAVLADRVEAYSIDQLRPTRSRRLGVGWVPVHVARLLDPAAADRDTLEAGDLVDECWAEVALEPDNLPAWVGGLDAWTRTLQRIGRFIEEHGDSRVPNPYFDADGRLDVIVENLRWHHAGRAGTSPGPYPGIDYAADLDRLPGWEW